MNQTTNPTNTELSYAQKLEIYEKSKEQAKGIAEAFLLKDEELSPDGLKALEIIEQFFVMSAEQLVLMLPVNLYAQRCLQDFERCCSLAKKSVHAHAFNLRKQKEANDKRAADAGSGQGNPGNSNGSGPGKESPVLSEIDPERKDDQGGGKVV